MAKQVWKVIRNNGISNKKKFLDIVPCSRIYYFINRKLIESNYKSDQFYMENKHNIYFTTIWTEAKRNLLYGWLYTIAYLTTFRVLYQ